MSEKMDPGTFSYGLVEHVADTEGEDRLEGYLAEVVGEVFLLVPAVRQRISALLIQDLKEEVARREDSRQAHATIELINRIENDWGNERG